MAHRDLNVLDAAEGAAVLVNALIARRRRRRLVEVRQFQKAAMAVPLNIREGFGRRPGADRNYKLEVARGEAEEVIGCLHTNYQSNRISKGERDSLRNRYITIVKMLDSLIYS